MVNFYSFSDKILFTELCHFIVKFPAMDILFLAIRFKR
jgi:hypothetical protein